MKTGFVKAAMYPPGELSETAFTGNGTKKLQPVTITF